MRNPKVNSRKVRYRKASNRKARSRKVASRRKAVSRKASNRKVRSIKASNRKAIFKAPNGTQYLGKVRRIPESDSESDKPQENKPPEINNCAICLDPMEYEERTAYWTDLYN